MFIVIFRGLCTSCIKDNWLGSGSAETRETVQETKTRSLINLDGGASRRPHVNFQNFALCGSGRDDKMAPLNLRNLCLATDYLLIKEFSKNFENY